MNDHDSHSVPAASAGSLVTFHCSVKKRDGEGVSDSSGGEPFYCRLGCGALIPGLERHLEGRRPGDRFELSLACHEAYGDRTSPGPQPIPLRYFPDEVPLEPGTLVLAEAEDGDHLPVWIVHVDPDGVLVDTDHPLAGEELSLSVELLAVEEPGEVAPRTTERSRPAGRPTVRTTARPTLAAGGAR